MSEPTTARKLIDWLAAQFRWMHATERVNYRLRKWGRHPLRTLRLWRAHHDSRIARAAFEKFDAMCRNPFLLIRDDDETDDQFRERLKKLTR